MTPRFSTASMKYSEQVGENRHLSGSHGERKR